MQSSWTVRHFQLACVLSFVAFLTIIPGIMGEIALLKRLKSSRITRYMDSIKTKVRAVTPSQTQLVCLCFILLIR